MPDILSNNYNNDLQTEALSLTRELIVPICIYCQEQLTYLWFTMKIIEYKDHPDMWIMHIHKPLSSRAILLTREDHPDLDEAAHFEIVEQPVTGIDWFRNDIASKNVIPGYVSDDQDTVIYNLGVPSRPRVGWWRGWGSRVVSSWAGCLTWLTRGPEFVHVCLDVSACIWDWVCACVCVFVCMTLLLYIILVSQFVMWCDICQCKWTPYCQRPSGLAYERFQCARNSEIKCDQYKSNINLKVHIMWYRREMVFILSSHLTTGLGFLDRP